MQIWVICKFFISFNSILHAYILISERSIAFKHTLEPSNDTFEVFGSFEKNMKFDHKSQGVICKISIKLPQIPIKMNHEMKT
jgi:hypothetical protein